MRVDPQKLVTGASLAADYTSPEINVDHIGMMGIQLVFTGTPTGTFKLQGSVVVYEDSGTVNTWTDVADSSQAVSAAGNHMWNFTDIGFNRLRVVYTRTSGTGSLDIRTYTKGF
jgi:hypothetical protein